MDELSKITGSRIRAQELLLVLEDVRAVVRQGYDDISRIKEFCIANELFFVEAPFKVAIKDNDNFSNHGERSTEGMTLCYISKDEKTALLACYYEVMNDHKKLGNILGYPACCVTYFMQHFPEDVNPVLEPTNTWTNLTKREEDACLLSHFPCSSDCVKSIEMARRNFEVLRKKDEAYARKLFEVLSDF